MKVGELRAECEKRGLSKLGKKKDLEERLSSVNANAISHVPAANSLELSKEPSIHFSLGDCLHKLNELDNESVRMIYLDPPFNSDRNYVLSVDSELGFNDSWNKEEYVKFVKKVVDICHGKLTRNGTLFFHISAEKMFVPEGILREKFKFVQPIFWKRCRSKNNVKSKLGTTVDIIFKCTKSVDALFNMVSQAKDAKYLENSFKRSDEKGKYTLAHVMTESTKKGYEYPFTFGEKTFNPAAGWRIKQDDLEKLRKENRLYAPPSKTAKLYKKIYLHENPGRVCSDLWDDIHSIGRGNELRNYPTAKPQKLLERLILISTNKNDLVVDPMCGSGTTGQACKSLERRCIMFDTNKDVANIIQLRFNKI